MIEKEKCKHKNWIVAGYPVNEQSVYQVQSLYDVYCTDCDNFVNLLTDEIINDKGLVKVNV